MGDLECFRVRAMEIVRKSRDLVRCLQLMRIKAGSILGAGALSDGRACSSLDISISSQGAMAATGKGIRTRKSRVSTGPVEADAMTSAPAEARLAAPSVDVFGRYHGMVPLSESNVETVCVISEVRVSLQVCVNAGPGFQQIDGVSCSDPVRFNCKQFEKSEELNRSYAGKFRKTDISRARFDYGVPVEEEPDPGGVWVLGHLPVVQDKEVGLLGGGINKMDRGSGVKHAARKLNIFVVLSMENDGDRKRSCTHMDDR